MVVGTRLKIEFKITGMDCPSCELALMNELEEQPGVKKALVEYIAGDVSVEFDEKIITEAEIKDVICYEGYEIIV